MSGRARRRATAAAVNIALALILSAPCGGGASSPSAAAVTCAEDEELARTACLGDAWCRAQLDTRAPEFAALWACACGGAASPAPTLARAVADAQATQALPLCGSGQLLSAAADEAGEAGEPCGRGMCKCERMTGPAFTWTDSQHSCDYAQSDLISPTLSLALCLQIIVSVLGVALAVSRWPMEVS
jgi:hypothetical protein